MALTIPDGHKANDGLELNAEYTKSRGLAGDIVKAFCAKLISAPDNSYVTWHVSNTQKQDKENQVKELHEQHNNIMQIADKTGMSKSKVHRILKKQNM